MRYTYEIRWAGVICIQTGLAGALLLSCREPHCSSFKQMHSAHFSAINILYTYKSLFNYAGLQVTIIVKYVMQRRALLFVVQITFNLKVSNFTSVYQTSGICHNSYLTNCMTLQCILVHPQCPLKCSLHTGCCKHCMKYAWFHV